MDFFINTMQPLSLTDDPHFRRMLEYFQNLPPEPKFRVPSRKTLTTNIKDYGLRGTQELKEIPKEQLRRLVVATQKSFCWRHGPLHCGGQKERGHAASQCHTCLPGGPCRADRQQDCHHPDRDPPAVRHPGEMQSGDYR